MIEGLFGQSGRNCGCDCGHDCGKHDWDNKCNCKFNLGGNSSCRVLIYLVVLYVIFNCGLLTCGIDLCTLLILLMFICCFCKGKSKNC